MLACSVAARVRLFPRQDWLTMEALPVDGNLKVAHDDSISLNLGSLCLVALSEIYALARLVHHAASQLPQDR